MKKLKVGSLLSVAVLVSLFSCGGDDEPTRMNIPVTFLAEGATFRYYKSDFFSEDSVITTIEAQIGKDTFLVKNRSVAETVIPTQYWVLKDDNFYSSFRMRDPNSYVIECKFNEPKGTSWKVKKGGVTYTYEIKEVNATITTGIGPIEDAVAVEVSAPNGASAVQYFSPSVGPIGTGDFEDESEPLRLVKYKLGTPATTTNVIPAITFGSFPFLKVNNYWEYYEETWFGEDYVTVTVESKLPGTEIFKVAIEYESDPGNISYGFWFEDNGYLMAYDEGEEIEEADILYQHEDDAVLNDGWGSQTGSGTFWIYKNAELDVMVDSYFGNVSSTGVYVTDGLFSSQTNYWNLNKGNVLVEGIVYRDVVDSNARKNKQKSFPTIFSY